MAEAVSLEAALAELAVDPIGVLRASGVKGLPRSSCNCPVAEFMRLRTGAEDASIGTTVMVGSGGVYQSRKTPKNIFQAIRAIDAGEHPELCR